jgi:hypothetical protein
MQVGGVRDLAVLASLSAAHGDMVEASRADTSERTKERLRHRRMALQSCFAHALGTGGESSKNPIGKSV